VTVIDLKRLTFEELGLFVAGTGQKPYRARQLAAWIFQRGVCSFDEMSDLPADYRQTLSQTAQITYVKELARQTSADGTMKFLFGLADGAAVESVLISDKNRRTLCVSSQVGCKLGCAFCLTGMAGFTRDLAPEEIVDQVPRARALSPEGRITNLVLMGMGEPLDNLDNVIRALAIITDPEYKLVGARKITVSTAGLVPGIERLGREFPKVKLAVSINAGSGAVRDAIMPVNRKYPLEDLARALARFPLPKGRRITLEYVLIGGVNDSKEEAEGLGRLAKRFPSKINLIPFNPAPGISFDKPSAESMARFQQWLFGMGIPAFIRESKGADILAACGQLRGSAAG
jgi:23S rRNA (adenine2503-C2)-methyltransferase